jgi:hypothetical protein
MEKSKMNKEAKVFVPKKKEATTPTEADSIPA